MIDAMAFAAIVTAGLFLLALGTCALVAPATASRFLLGFAGSRAKHGVELVLRLLVGAALVRQAPQMPGAAAFRSIGWVLCATTVVLACVPWDWHRRFARRAVPAALRFLPGLGATSLIAGGLVLLAASSGMRA